MTRRVLIQGGQAAAIQVSLPGFDVLSATLDQMAFDARFGNMRLVQSGTIYVPNLTTQTVYLPTSYSTVPRVVAGFEQANTPFACSGPVQSVGSGLVINSAYLVFATQSYLQFTVTEPNNPAVSGIPNSYWDCYVFYAVYF
jgi:hypothetical protein